LRGSKKAEDEKFKRMSEKYQIPPSPPFLRGEKPLKFPLVKGDARGIESAAT
jgi:hypothetical protein